MKAIIIFILLGLATACSYGLDRIGNAASFAAEAYCTKPGATRLLIRSVVAKRTAPHTIQIKCASELQK